MVCVSCFCASLCFVNGFLGKRYWSIVFFTWDDVVRICREVAQFPRDFVSDELRGWNWSRPPVLFTGCVRLGVSDVVGEFCSSGRDVYLRYVVRVRERVSERVFVGALVHRIFHELVVAVKRVLYGSLVESGMELLEVLKSEGKKVFSKVVDFSNCPLSRDFVESLFWNLWSQGATVYSGMFDKIRRGRTVSFVDSLALQVVPLVSEVCLDGSLVGLGNVRVDAVLYPNIPVEIKVGQGGRGELALAGYALVMESLFSQPVDFGILVNVSVNQDGEVSWSWKLVQISDDLRLEFLHERDRKADIVDKQIDPGLSQHCSPSCPFYEYCTGKRVETREKKAQDKPSRRVRIRML